MAGGTWKAQNKIRPGAYINFKAVPKPSNRLGSRGVMTMPVPLSWGPEGKVIELLSTDLLDGKSLAKIGYVATDAESLVFRQALRNCYKALVYRLDTGGVKATATAGNLTAVAKYPGVLGNRIAIVVVENTRNRAMWDVVTLFKESEKDRQTILKTAEASSLKANDYVEWSGDGELTATVTAGVYLAGGTNGTVNSGTYTNYFAAVKGLNWNTMGIPQDETIATEAVKGTVVDLIRNLRENQGKKVQAVLLKHPSNYEGIISVRQGYTTADEEISPATFVAYYAGLTAGAELDESKTYAAIDGATSIIYMEGDTTFDNEEIIQLLQSGQIVLTTRQDGVVVVEQDINTLHSPYPSQDVNYSFSKNRVIRTLDQINNDVKLMWEVTYVGKVDNNDDGRNLFKADCINYLNKLQTMAAIQNFDSATDIEVLAGEAIDAVVVNLAIQPVDAMEKLYMTVNVD